MSIRLPNTLLVAALLFCSTLGADVFGVESILYCYHGPSDTVYLYDAVTGQSLSSWKMPMGMGKMAVDQGILYNYHAHYDRVYKFGANTGVPLNSWPMSPAVTHLAADAGVLYRHDGPADTIYRYDGQNGPPLGSWHIPIGVTHMAAEGGVLYNHHGPTDRILMYDGVTGTSLGSWAIDIGMNDLAADGGVLYVYHAPSDRILRYDADTGNAMGSLAMSLGCTQIGAAAAPAPRMNAMLHAPSAGKVIVGAQSSVQLDIANVGETLAQDLTYDIAFPLARQVPVTSPLTRGAGITHTINLVTDVAGMHSDTLTVASSAKEVNGQAGSMFSEQVALTVMDHSNASFGDTADVNTWEIDFGEVLMNTTQQTTFAIHNLVDTSGFTADLELTSPAGLGDTNVLTVAGSLQTIAPGDSVSFGIDFSTSVLGEYEATYTFVSADQALPGAAFGHDLTVTLRGVVVPEPATFALLSVAGLALVCRRKQVLTGA